MKETKRYYVTMRREIRDGFKTAWLLGPYINHETALANVTRARIEANEIDPRSAFDAFGTSARTAESHPWGILTKNHEKPLAQAPFASYRIMGRFGWIMIAAMNAQDAMREAERSNSTNYKLAREALEIWDGEKYINALYFP